MNKTITILMAFAFFTVNALAQDNKIYLKAGLNLANVSTSDDGSYDNANGLASFHAGFMADLPLGKVLSVQPGLLFTGKGSKLETGSSTDAIYYKNSVNPYYIELPVNLIANIPLVDGESKFFIGAGAYAAAGIAGKYKSTFKTPAGTIESDGKIEFTNDDPTTSEEEGAGLGLMKRFDYGINGTAGFAFKNMLVSVNYGHGLAKLNSGTSNTSNDNNKNRVWSISFGVSL
ncbi:outer membrane beta-barrel protein [Flavihumibacter fluvii]|uniref:outer membrane beta-barrel protein n=1 Tax=Flavihumibacter fluvii TaxID=2838157 RepID=UPI001BDE9989|nr:outer membrane beta-barrel protein [Flavihumibacter fluvii]ULQ51433.1 PorT family protein [Flavihumibacter fluvii]